jgi:malate synthase A
VALRVTGDTFAGSTIWNYCELTDIETATHPDLPPALAKVRADKLREVTDGHDGTWVAHPGLVPVARAIFDEHMKAPSPIARKREDVKVSEADLLGPAEGTRTEAGLRHNIRVGAQSLESWLRGTGFVPIYNLMEDAATAEISRAQVWQWLRRGMALDSGKKVTRELFLQLVDEEMERVRQEVGDERFSKGPFPEARALHAKGSTEQAQLQPGDTVQAAKRAIDQDHARLHEITFMIKKSKDMPTRVTTAIMGPRAVPVA